LLALMMPVIRAAHALRMFDERLADRFKEPKRPRYFKRAQLVEIEVVGPGNRTVWEAGKVIRRLRKDEDLPLRTSAWEPISSWYLVQFDADGTQGWAPKSNLRAKRGT
jgi:hypothetical protein